MDCWVEPKIHTVLLPSPLRERLLDHELARLAVIAFDKPLSGSSALVSWDQRRAAADHDAVVLGRERRKAEVGEQFA